MPTRNEPFRRRRWAIAGAAVISCGLFIAGMYVVVVLARIARIREPEPSLAGAAIVAATHLPPFVLALGLVHLLTCGVARLTGRTICGHCGGTLRDLVEPRCPACRSAL